MIVPVPGIENPVALYMVPGNIADALRDYVENHHRKGSFVMAVLQNDLFGAWTHADEISKRYLDDICRFVWNELPGTCWGSVPKVEAWINEPFERNPD